MSFDVSLSNSFQKPAHFKASPLKVGGLSLRYSSSFSSAPSDLRGMGVVGNKGVSFLGLVAIATWR